MATEGPLGYAATHLARKLNIPVASGFHTNFQSYSDHYRLGWFRKLIADYLVHMHNLTDCTIVPTVEQSQVLRDMGIHQVAVVGRGVDTNLFNPGRRSTELRQSWGANEKTPVMIYVGRIAEEKNLDLTLRCYDELKAMDPSLVFIMVGKGPVQWKEFAGLIRTSFSQALKPAMSLALIMHRRIFFRLPALPKLMAT